LPTTYKKQSIYCWNAVSLDALLFIIGKKYF
jgi:hypothetical protein